MQRRFHIHTRMLKAQLLAAAFWLCAVSTTAYAESPRWGYQPTYSGGAASPITVRISNATVANVGSSGGLPVGGATGGSSSYSPGSSNASVSYSFRTTSVYIPSTGKSYTPIADRTEESAGKTPRKSNPWDDTPGEDDNPIGQTPDPTPVGDAMWLMLLFALLYGAYRYTQKKRLALR